METALFGRSPHQTHCENENAAEPEERKPGHDPRHVMQQTKINHCKERSARGNCQQVNQCRKKTQMDNAYAEERCAKERRNQSGIIAICRGAEPSASSDECGGKQ